MEILHLVGLSVVVAVAAVIHAYPHRTVVLRELTHAPVKLWSWHYLSEQFFLARLRIQARGSWACVAEPDESLTIYVDGDDRLSGSCSDGLGLLSVGIREDLAVGSSRVDVEAVRIETGDLLAGEDAFALQREIVFVEPADAVVGTQPDVALIALGHTCDAEPVDGHEVTAEPLTVELEDVEANALDAHQYVA